MGTWMNDDNLYIKFGASRGVQTHPAGSYRSYTDGNVKVLEVVVTLASLTETETIINDNVWLPNDAHVLWVETTDVVVAATGTAIDVGLIQQDDRTTEMDYNGLLAAFPTAEMAQIGETRKFYETHTVPTSMTGTGALIGTELTGTGYLSASMTDSTSFTAGVVRIKVGYIPRGVETP